MGWLDATLIAGLAGAIGTIIGALSRGWRTVKHANTEETVATSKARVDESKSETELYLMRQSHLDKQYITFLEQVRREASDNDAERRTEIKALEKRAEIAEGRCDQLRQDHVQCLLREAASKERERALAERCAKLERDVELLLAKGAEP